MDNQDLRKAGLKVTLPRVKILQQLEKSEERHLSAEDIYKSLMEAGEDVGLATVYRVLTQFEQAGMVLRIVAEGKQRANGIEPDPKVLDMLQQTTAQKLDSQSTALYGTARLWDDGIIDPRDTRRVVAYALDICDDAEQRQLHPNSFGVARL